MNWSAAPVSSTFSAKFFSVSNCKRSRIFCEVTCLPSFPKNGELLIENNMLMVGLSISIVGKASGISGSAIVSPISNPSIPFTATISPAMASFVLDFPSPSNVINSLMRAFFTLPSLRHNAMGIFSVTFPRVTRPIAIRPVNELKSSDVICICNGPSDTAGAGMVSTIVSRRYVMSFVFVCQSGPIHFSFPEP